MDIKTLKTGDRVKWHSYNLNYVGTVLEQHADDDERLVAYVSWVIGENPNTFIRYAAVPKNNKTLSLFTDADLLEFKLLGTLG